MFSLKDLCSIKRERAVRQFISKPTVLNTFFARRFQKLNVSGF